ncbi:MAG: hypothetical protein AB7G23_13015 [Vicinamibacterales bacterium]
MTAAYRTASWIAGLLLVLAAAAPARAQGRPPAPATSPATPLRGAVTVDVGLLRMSAGRSFDALFDQATATVLGGGADLVIGDRLWAAVRISRATWDGERAFVDDGRVFRLGIPLSVRLVPVEISAGYRLVNRSPFTPYFGGGLGFHRYTETSSFADASEDVEETFSGYHVLGGVEGRLRRLVRVAGEVQWTRVPDALGGDGSVGAAFGESGLGGTAVRAKLLIGR